MAFIKIDKDTFGEMKALGLANEFYTIDKQNNKHYARDFYVADRRSAKSKTYYTEEDIYNNFLKVIKDYIIVRKQIFNELIEFKYLKFDDGNYMRVNKKIYVKKSIYDEYIKYL